MTNIIRQHRVRAFADWLGSVPGEPPFYTRPEFKFFEDLTQPEFAAAAEIMRTEAAQFELEADALQNEVARREADNG